MLWITGLRCKLLDTVSCRQLWSRALTNCPQLYPSIQQQHPPSSKKKMTYDNNKQQYSISTTLHQQGGENPFIFRQLFEHKSHTYTYLLACKETKEALLIDPVYEMVARDEKLIQQLGLILKYAMNTHIHADHITGTGKLKEHLTGCQSVLGIKSGAKADVYLADMDKLSVGKLELEARSTPGHTNGCTSYVWHQKGFVFTGDTVLIRGCGRTDFQQGSPETLYNSVHKQIFSLPDHYALYPAHDYTGQTSSTVAEEKELNPRLTKTKDEFVQIMSNLNLPYPKQIDRALPANLECGIFEEDEVPSTGS